MRRRSSRGRDDGRVLDAIQLALDGLRAAPDLAAGLDQVAVGAARVTNASRVVMALRRGEHLAIHGTAGREAATWGERRIRTLAVGGATSGATVVDFPATHAAGLLLLDDPHADRLPALELYCRCASALVDLQVMTNRNAQAEHQVLAADRLAGVLGSLAGDDGIILVGVGGGDDEAQAAAAHLLQGTRPPGDAVLHVDGQTFLVVLRSLKAPVDVVGLRLLDGWRALHPDIEVSLGAAVHEEGEAPLDSYERAQGALESCRRSGGGFHVAAVPPRGPQG
jgi:hypothetical protein